ncbi:MAG TPA: sigma-54 dependent transcriptional regulator [Planctomycetota bacterium]|nr:sigma-54 dependent transcriptional regulator [Planctomycetota bacterium]
MRILVVDDDPAVAEHHVRLLEGLGHDARAETDPEKVDLRLGEDAAVELVLLDLRMPRLTGLDVLHRVRLRRPDVGVVMATVVNDVEQAVLAVKAGAYNYLLKPLEAGALDRVLRSYAANRPPAVVDDPRFRPFVTGDPAFREIFRRAQAFAGQDVPVLVQGETGTGKELVARLIHALSARSGEGFLAVNMAAFQATLFESELFGHVRGAFTGASRDRAGRFEEAGRGTLFLDEIGELDLEQQRKLLRVLEGGRYSRVGESAERAVEARIVLATHRDLRQDVAAGRFREDLYYRVSSYTIALPPLRERPGDVELLAGYFLRKYACQFSRPARDVSPQALALLKAYDYPGNVRELEGIVSAAVLLEPSATVQAGSLPRHLASRPAADEGSLERARFETVRRALAENDGNQTRAAAKLGIARQTLNYLLKDYRDRGWM